MEVITMKKTFRISDNVVKLLEDHAKENRTTQSRVVEVAISLYMAMYQGTKAMANTIDSFKVPGQSDIFELLNNKK